MNTKKPKQNFAQKAYRYTKVDYLHTQASITKMLEQIGITDVQITKSGTDWEVTFIAKLRHDEGARKVKMEIPFNTELDEKEEDTQRRRDAIFRAFYWHIRDKFITVQKGLKEFEEAFLADLVIVAEGREQRLGDVLIPRYKEMLKNSKVAVFQIESGVKA